MEYYARHKGSHSYVGPSTLDEICNLIAAKRLPADCELIEATGQSEWALRNAKGWVDAWSVISKPKSQPPPADTKKCPFCAETIRGEAVICRYCGYDLRSSQPTRPGAGQPAYSQPVVKAQSGVMDGVKLGCGMFVVLPLLLGIIYAIFIVIAATLTR